MDHAAAYVKPHRATMLLVFSILSWVVCFIFGIVAYLMAKSDLEEMHAGRMDPAGEGMTYAAKIVALVSVIVSLVGVVLGVVGAVVMIAIGGIAAASNP